jgi:glutamine synthetase
MPSPTRRRGAALRRTSRPSSAGRANDSAGFIQRHGLWSIEQQEAAGRVEAEVREKKLDQVRIGWGDQHGIVRGKTLTAEEFSRVLREGKDFQFVTAIFDTTNHPIVPPFGRQGAGIPAEMTGLPDGILVPDPTTFRVIPWVPHCGWVLSDAYFQDGRSLPLSTRAVMRRALDELAKQGYVYVAALEVEFLITKLEDPMLSWEQSGYPADPPRVSAISHGFQYLTDNRGDEINQILQILQENVRGLGLPLRTVEDEWGPGQTEFTFDPLPGLESADNMLFFRSALKQVARRSGYHITFMARPLLPNIFPNGWHLHESLRASQTGRNAFTSQGGSEPLSPLGRNFLGGLLEHSRAASLFATPTVNGYKRFQPDSFAPTHATWAFENRGVMLRVMGEPGSEATHIENRVGEPAANPYLYMASQITCGMDGVAKRTDPGAPSEEGYSGDRPPLPTSIMEAVAALEQDKLFRRAWGDPFVDYMLLLKKFEINRFLTTVTDWEHREYFEVY